MAYQMNSISIVNRISLNTLAAAPIVACLGATQVHAQLSNSSFETDSIVGLVTNSEQNITCFTHLAGPGQNACQVPAASVPGWQTTSSVGTIEVWNNNFLDVEAHSGTQHVELNSTENSALFQEKSGIAAGQLVDFHFAHRAREGTDTMRLTITDLGADNMFGTADDTELFTDEYSATTEQWEFNTSEGLDPIETLGNTMRFSYAAVSAGSNNLAIGNFIDSANFGVGVLEATPPTPSTPEPASFGLLGLGALGLLAIRRKSRRSN